MPTTTRTRIEGTVTHYPYRTAMVRDVFATGLVSDYADLWQALADNAGARPDNHQAFGLTSADGVTVYFMFTDYKVLMGTSIEERAW